jgi:hypothetical protein
MVALFLWYPLLTVLDVYICIFYIDFYATLMTVYDGYVYF